ncbi:MAG TPA: hypothetical protein VD931_04700 [Baekduia sp.]|nr:hypothetical protein [Baekduia sp.]
MTVRRRLALTALAVVLAVAGLAAGYVKLELAEPERFADRAVDALQAREVRSVIAEQVAVELVERGSPQLVASRPLVLTAVEAVLQTDEFTRVLHQAAIAAHAVLLEGDRDVVIELEEGRELLVPAVESVSPDVAEQIPADISPRIAEIRRSDAATWLVRAADSSGPAAILLLLGASALLAFVVWRAPDRRVALAGAGLVLAAGAGAGLIAMAALREQVVSHAGEIGVLSAGEARAAAGAGWDALAGDLERWILALGVAGLAVVGGALLSEARVDRAVALRHAAEIVAGGTLPRGLRLLRGLGLTTIGALVLLGAQPVLAAAVVVVGGGFVLLGLAEALSILGRPARPPTRQRRRPRRAVAAAAGAALLAGAVTGVVLVTRDGPPAPPEEAEITECNGLAVLCERRLDQVVLPGTHNSMSAADRPGWFFANQTKPVPEQLRDGIRVLMLDPHYGVVDAQGRVRTDLQAEGTSRNRVARQLGVESVGVAERLAGRLGLVPSDGEREIFLCHTLCELGAERISDVLGDLRGFLERHLSEVVVVIVESSVEAGEVESEFRAADLEPYLATLRRGAPLPTLRQMIASGRRLVVLDQGDGGDAPWYHAGFVVAQDTRIATVAKAPTACVPGRGTPESPLLLLNHWIDRFPPPPRWNRQVSRRSTILRRARACRARLGRIPNMVAVDFYDRGDVVAAVRALNRSGAAVADDAR